MGGFRHDKSVGYLSTLLYAMCKGNLPSFLDQLAQISGFTFEMRDGVIPMQLSSRIMTGARESFSMLYKGNLVSFPHQVASGIQISGFTFESAIIK